MNTGFSNLTTLKAHLLAQSMRTGTTFDAPITAIGLGVAAAIENHCNRKFMRTVADTEILAADKCQFLLSRYPLETITAIDLKTNEALGWEAQVINAFLNTIDQKAGIVNCPDGADVGPWYAQVRFTYTGGFFWEQLEPADDGYPTTPPVGSAALPPDLKLAWLLQCESIWAKRDKLGLSVADAPGKQSEIAAIELVPLVKSMIGQFIRYNMV